jgi:hypothetical protein
MKEPIMTNMTQLIGAATLLLVGCTPSTESIVDRSGADGPTAQLGKVTFHVAGMNQRLQIL